MRIWYTSYGVVFFTELSKSIMMSFGIWLCVFLHSIASKLSLILSVYPALHDITGQRHKFLVLLLILPLVLVVSSLRQPVTRTQMLPHTIFHNATLMPNLQLNNNSCIHGSVWNMFYNRKIHTTLIQCLKVRDVNSKLEYLINPCEYDYTP